jgi:hypothetical protein
VDDVLDMLVVDTNGDNEVSVGEKLIEAGFASKLSPFAIGKA